ncbi:MAG: PKD domain-containing protein [Planctomycetota bacterium]|nr:PKD domain-containing protein [Planctomycetota bacterium]
MRASLPAIGLALLTAAAGAAPLSAQTGSQCLATLNPFLSNNGGSAGGAVYFDMTVSSAIVLTDVVCNFASTSSGLPVGVDVYLTPGTSVGNEANPAAWNQIGSGSGLGAGQDQRSICTLSVPAIITPGAYGVALVAVGTSHRYTNGNGANQSYSDNFLSLQLGTATNVPFSGSPFSPRVANIELCYNPGNGLFPNFSATPTSGSSPLTVQFTDTSYTSDPGGILNWAWDFDNDGNVDSTQQNPSHTYIAGGSYTVTLLTIDAVNGARTETKNDFVVVDPITVDFTASTTLGAAPLTVQFTDTTAGNPIAWAWDFESDGIVDSTAQNPTWVYATGGTYTVTLQAANGANIASEVKADLITVVGATNNTASADVLEFQFNEPRGQTIANTASTTLAPLSSTVSVANWQGDAGRTGWQGNEPGFGALAAQPAGGVGVSTGFSPNLANVTVMWWQRMQTAPGTALAYNFGGPGAQMRCFTGGVAGTGLWYRGTAIGDIKTIGSVQGAPGVWQHVALSIDDVTGTADWYIDGVLDSSTAFTPGTHVMTNSDFTIGYHTAATSGMGLHYDVDDFRLYGNALTAGDIQLAMMQESPTFSSFGAGCAGPSGGAPSVTSSGGAPRVGNASFTLDVTGMEPGRPAVLALGGLVVAGGALPADVSFLLGTGCQIEIAQDVAGILGNGSGSASLPLGIPNNVLLAGAHLYGQVLVVGSGFSLPFAGALSPAIDINVQL